MNSYQTDTAQRTISNKSMSDTFIRSTERLELLTIYHDWLARNKPLYAKYFNVIAIIFMAILIPFDFVLFKNGLFYTRFRVLSIVLIGLNVLFLMRDQKLMKAPKRASFDSMLLFPGILFNFLYAYFLFKVDAEPYKIVLIANFMVIFFTTIFVHRFWKEQYSLNILSIIFIFFVGMLKPEIMSDCILLIICHVSSFIAAFFFRREFVASMVAFFHSNR